MSEFVRYHRDVSKDSVENSPAGMAHGWSIPLRPVTNLQTSTLGEMSSNYPELTSMDLMSDCNALAI